jgi:hypothetical protein
MSCTIELGTTLPQLRANLAAYFAPWLGTYTLPDGSSQAAIRVRKVPPDWRVAGIELTIEQSPERQLLAARYGAITGKRIWTLRFRDFGGNGLDPVRLAAFRAFPHATNRLQPETDNTYGQLVIELPDPTITTLP